MAEISTWSPMAREQIETAAGAGYLDRQRNDAEAFRKEDDLRLPANLDYGLVGSLSNEVREKLSRQKPLTLGQAARIEGVTPPGLPGRPCWPMFAGRRPLDVLSAAP